MVNSSSFEVIYLGKKDIVDTVEGNTTISIENGEKLLGTYGSADDPLSNNIQMFDPGATGYSRGTFMDTYALDNNVYNEKFTTDGATEQTFDALMTYSGTITYTDGTTAPVEEFHIFQDTDGNTYLAPDTEISSILSAKPIQSITLDELTSGTDAHFLIGQREADAFVGDPYDPTDTDRGTVFDVIHLGKLADMDGSEGNTLVDTDGVNANANKTYGSASDPLLNHIHRWAPGSTGFVAGDITRYDIDNEEGNDTFTIDGGTEKTVDSSMMFKNTILTYADGTTSAPFTAIVTQAKDGHAYLIPRTPETGGMIQMAKPIQSVELGEPEYSFGTNGWDIIGRRNDNQFVICFTTGTRILTDEGERPIETLAVGDRVITADRGPQEIRWIGRQDLSAAVLESNPKLKPVRIRAGALGEGVPQHDLVVSRQHRVLMRSHIVERITGEIELLMPAIKLIHFDGIDIVEACDSVTYYHMMCDHHEVIFAEGAATETLYPGPQALQMMGQDAYDEIIAIFPELASPGYNPIYARQLPKSGKVAKQIVARHTKNNVSAFGAAGISG